MFNEKSSWLSVIGIDNDRDIIKLLKENISLNGFDDHISVIKETLIMEAINLKI